MQKSKRVFLFVAVALMALAAGLILRPGAREVPPPTVAPTSAMNTQLENLAGGKSRLADWQGKVMVVNFWATWCAPCREEIPGFVKLQARLEARGLQFIGVAVDERDKVRAYAKEVGINYPLLVGEIDTFEVSKAFGNEVGALPFTVIIGRDGKVVRAVLGGLDEAKLMPILDALL